MNSVKSLLANIQKSLTQQTEIRKKIQTVYENDGVIIGNGSQDFTQDSKSYFFTINGEQIELIDVPGIEGKEQRYSEMIKKAVSKSHLVCFVTRESKQIETNSLEKISEYLGEKVEVMGILNVSINPQKEYTGESFYNDKIEEINNTKSDLLEESLLEKIPQRLYIGSKKMAVLPGLCGLCLKNRKTTFVSPEEENISTLNKQSLTTLRRQQQSFLKHSTREELIDMSGLIEFTNEIEQISKSAKKKIKIAAIHRLYDATDEFLKFMNDRESNVKNTFNSYIDLNNQYVSNLQSANTKLENNILNSISNNLKDLYYTEIFEKEIVPHINKYKKIKKKELENTLKEKQNSYMEQLSQKIEKSCKENIEDYFERVKQFSDDYQFNIDNLLKYTDIEIPDFNIKDNMKTLTNYITTILSNVGGYMLQGLVIGGIFGGGLIGSIIGAIVGFILSIPTIAMSETQKADKLKADILQQIEKQIEKSKAEYESEAEKIIKSVEKPVNEMIDSIKYIPKELNELISYYESFIENLTKIKQNIYFEECKYGQ